MHGKALQPDESANIKQLLNCGQSTRYCFSNILPFFQRILSKSIWGHQQ